MRSVECGVWSAEYTPHSPLRTPNSSVSLWASVFPWCRSQRGVTLTELLVAAAASLIVILAVTTTDTGRVRIDQDIRRHSGVIRFNHGLAALAAWRIAKGIENADRAVLVSPDASGVSAILQVRIPPTGATPPLETAAAYVWDEYRLTNDQLLAYRNIKAGCAAAEVLASEISAVQFSFRDEQPSPPGGEPFPDGADNNMVRVRMRWAAGSESHAFEEQIAIRSTPYSNVSASCPGGGASCDSGRGLAAPGVDDAPPTTC